MCIFFQDSERTDIIDLDSNVEDVLDQEICDAEEIFDMETTRSISKSADGLLKPIFKKPFPLIK